jgi:hypothetical protein
MWMDGWMDLVRSSYLSEKRIFSWLATDGSLFFFFLGCVCDCGFEPTLGFDHPILCWDPFLFAVVLAFNDYYSLYMDFYTLKA